MGGRTTCLLPALFLLVIPGEWGGASDPGVSLLSKGLSRVFSNTKVQSINSLALSLLFGPTLTSVHDYWKNPACRGTFGGRRKAVRDRLALQQIDGETVATVADFIFLVLQITADGD